MKDSQGALQLAQGCSGPGDPCANGFGTVHGGAAANGNQSLTVVPVIEPQGGLHIGDGGIGPGLGIDGVGNTAPIEGGFQLTGNAAADDAFIGDNQHPLDILFGEHGAQLTAAAEDFRLPVGQHRQRGPQHGLNRAAIECFDGIHFSPS